LLVVGVATACSSSAPADALQQACASYVAAVRTAEYQCYGVPPEGNETVLWQRQTEACVLNAQAPGSTLGAAFWQSVATVIDASLPQCAGYEYSDTPGTLAVGEPCLLGTQCSTLWCSGTGVVTSAGTIANDAAACGTCAERITVGATCNVATDACVHGASCFDGACRALGQQGVACAQRSDCSFPLVCTSQGTCGPVEWLGDPCETAADCANDMACDPSTSLCVADTFNLPGQACDGVAERCELGLCDTSTGLCPPVVQDGAACDPTDPTTLCNPYATCFRNTCQIINPKSCQ
jgi:hypothetical protein